MRLWWLDGGGDAGSDRSCCVTGQSDDAAPGQQISSPRQPLTTTAVMDEHQPTSPVIIKEEELIDEDEVTIIEDQCTTGGDFMFASQQLSDLQQVFGISDGANGAFGKLSFEGDGAAVLPSGLGGRYAENECSESGLSYKSCPVCQKRITHNHLRRHIRTQHTAMERVVCPYCNRLLKNQYSLETHIANYHK